MSYSRKFVSLVASCALSIGLIGIAQTSASAAGAVTFTVNDGTAVVEGAFVSVVTKATAGVDTDGDTLIDVSAGGTVTGGTTNDNGVFVAKLPDGTDLPDGDYSYAVAKPGFGVKVGSFTVSGAALSLPTISLTANANKMEFVNAHGAQVTGIVADAQSCVFYATTSSIPSLYRTTDCAGNWAPVVLNRDEKAETSGNDGFEGMDNTQTATFVTTSGYPGEVAAKVGNKIWFSRDFGTTWNSFNAPNGNVDGIHWAHVTDSVTTPGTVTHGSFMFISTGDSRDLNIRVMPAGENGSIADSTPTEDPTITTAVVSNFKVASPNTSLIRTVAAQGSSVDPGTVLLVRSNAAGAGAWALTTNMTAAQVATRLGGNADRVIPLTRTDTSNYTDLLVAGITDYDHGLAVYVYDREPAGATVKAQAYDLANDVDVQMTAMYGAANNGTPASISAITGNMNAPAPSCGENDTPPVGSMAPVMPDLSGNTDFAGFDQMAMIRSCLFVSTINGTTFRGTAIPAGTTLVMDVSGANNNTGSAFDSGFNLTGNNVVLSGDGARGIVKAATFKQGSPGPVASVKNLSSNFAGVPLFPTPAHVLNNYIQNRAEAGTAETSGGFAVQGMTSPTVKDVATSPIDPAASLAGFSFTGGGRTVMSVDSGASYFTVGGGGSNAVTWWVDQDDNQWIAGGSSGNANTFMSVGQFTNAQYTALVQDVQAGTDIDSPTYSGTRLAFGMPLREGDATTGFGSKSFGLGDMQGELTGLVGIMGTRKVLVAGSNGDDKSTLAMVNLSGTGTNTSIGSVSYLNSAGSFVSDSTLTNGILTTPSFTGARITSIQYCPVGSAALVADKAFIALADEDSDAGTGGVRVISNLTTAPVLSTPTGISLSTSDNVRDLKVECDTGSVVAISRGVDGQGGGTPQNGPTIWFSLDGGVAFDRIQNTAQNLPPQITNVETVALEADPVSGEVKIGLVSTQGDVVAVTFDADSILDDVGLTMDQIAEPTLPAGVDASDFVAIGNADLALTEINDSGDAEGFAFGGEKPGDFEFAADENELDDLGALARALGRYPNLRGIAGVAPVQPDPLLGSGAGALTSDISGSGSSGGGGGTPQNPTINVTAAGSAWASGVSKPLKYNTAIAVAATDTAGQVTITPGVGCMYGGGKITATAGSGMCTVTFNSPSGSVTRSFTLSMATPVKPPTFAAPKVKKSVTMPATGRVGTKTYRYTYSLKSGSSSYCTLSGTKLTGKKAGTNKCVVYVTSPGVGGFVAALPRQTITLTIKK